jgi:hypothetical protein
MEQAAFTDAYNISTGSVRFHFLVSCFTNPFRSVKVASRPASPPPKPFRPIQRESRITAGVAKSTVNGLPATPATH